MSISLHCRCTQFAKVQIVTGEICLLLAFLNSDFVILYVAKVSTNARLFRQLNQSLRYGSETLLTEANLGTGDIGTLVCLHVFSHCHVDYCLSVNLLCEGFEQYSEYMRAALGALGMEIKNDNRRNKRKGAITVNVTVNVTVKEVLRPIVGWPTK
ncbi:hypothetical protein CFOL_v3_22028 [Cephalotus follicularis]|uniref:Uncharacterized protein n=1 Tax=Cephalotus follicularis TaxID=3775 RepID=A0A1Q3CEJ5_CEPFO|nr:hypothetical protein CFOL_v3_22028 [Cephalotus follicularis]